MFDSTGLESGMLPPWANHAERSWNPGSIRVCSSEARLPKALPFPWKSLGASCWRACPRHLAIQDPPPCTPEHPLGPQRLWCARGRWEERRQKCHIDLLGKRKRGLLSHITGKLVMWPHLDSVGAGQCSPWLSNRIPVITAHGGKRITNFCWTAIRLCHNRH